MKKQLNATPVINELKGASAYFPSNKSSGETKRKSIVSSPMRGPQRPEMEKPRSQESEPASTLASEHDSMLEEVRKVVRAQGKEVSYVRLTREEKNQLADIIYSYKRQGIRTTETEISRIAINYLIEDYRRNGKTSILARLLERLNA
jgi:hypothetical protein